MKKSNRKGFTIVELVIVIAVIAILAAVLIPTFSNLIKKANESSDIQAVRQMNTILAAEGAVENNNIFEVYSALEASGLDAKDYKPLVSGHYFFWDDKADCIVYTDANYDVIFPKDYDKATKGNWFSLTAKIATKEIEGFADKTEVAVTTAAEFAYVVEQYKAGNHKAASLTIDLGGNVLDMMGADVTISNSSGKLDKNVTIKNGTIKNIASIDAAHAGKGGEHEDGFYYAGGLFASLGNGKHVVISDLTIENAHVQSTHTESVGILAGSVGNKSSLTVNNVTIKNSTVIALNNVGALVGNAYNLMENVDDGEGIFLSGNIVLDNVQVQAVGGRSGLVIGYLPDADTYLNDTSTITLKNGSSYSLYECAQNKGEGYGLQEDGTTLNYWANNKNGVPSDKNNQYFVGAYATYAGEVYLEFPETAFNGFNKVVVE